MVYKLESTKWKKNVFIIDMAFLLLISKGLSGLAGSSSVSQLVADHMSFSDPKLKVITDVTPLAVVVDLDPSR